ncbi:uncharacterized protein PGTG_02855 [Puccinia graminis f. sp. tritici CRL 75-36-700-3]|uniref:Uncharacterized protein n=1 Tax=Puccinia graminis f. sp. tritici (strain CRL 75-36-700-3 / race SCCL) TaxID=418459 RepID=E3JWI9_PUCGT|nr:uncharacterized protein PGTG_02855 [Puccinia graminis f. sp. tritici CRL 75-36-700-3]EFP76414.1 hypothetical protein PGTG_02855 [Puccinia graminis f. sp. tritici CRL 75-36-700-3]
MKAGDLDLMSSWLSEGDDGLGFGKVCSWFSQLKAEVACVRVCQDHSWKIRQLLAEHLESGYLFRNEDRTVYESTSLLNTQAQSDGLLGTEDADDVEERDE